MSEPSSQWRVVGVRGAVLPRNPRRRSKPQLLGLVHGVSGPQAGSNQKRRPVEGSETVIRVPVTHSGGSWPENPIKPTMYPVVGGTNRTGDVNSGAYKKI